MFSGEELRQVNSCPSLWRSIWKRLCVTGDRLSLLVVSRPCEVRCDGGSRDGLRVERWRSDEFGRRGRIGGGFCGSPRDELNASCHQSSP